MSPKSDETRAGKANCDTAYLKFTDILPLSHTIVVDWPRPPIARALGAAL